MKVRSFLVTAVALCVLSISAWAQKPANAADFTLSDCDGAQHHLYDALDNGRVVIMEFVMGCLPCVQGGKALSSIRTSFESSNPGKVEVFTFGYSSGTDCSFMQSWMNTNKLTNPTFAGDDGVIMSYQAEGGMPTIVVAGGADHKVLYWKKGFSNKDTTAIKQAVNQALNPQASVSSSNAAESLAAYPNPAPESVHLSFHCQEAGKRDIALFSSLGEKILSISNDNLSAGEHSFDFTTKNVAAGKYFITVTFGKTSRTIPLTIVH